MTLLTLDCSTAALRPRHDVGSASLSWARGSVIPAIHQLARHRSAARWRDPFRLWVGEVALRGARSDAHEHGRLPDRPASRNEGIEDIALALSRGP